MVRSRKKKQEEIGRIETSESDLSEMAVCKKDSHLKVVQQNEKCRKICGVRVGEKCRDNCMEHYRRENPHNRDGTFRFEGAAVGGSFYDVLMIKNSAGLITLMVDLAAEHRQGMKIFKESGLTRRELEIVELIEMGRSNRKISADLFISEMTLKKHINNILKKVPKSYWKRKISK